MWIPWLKVDTTLGPGIDSDEERRHLPSNVIVSEFVLLEILTRHRMSRQNGRLSESWSAKVRGQMNGMEDTNARYQ